MRDTSYVSLEIIVNGTLKHDSFIEIMLKIKEINILIYIYLFKLFNVFWREHEICENLGQIIIRDQRIFLKRQSRPSDLKYDLHLGSTCKLTVITYWESVSHDELHITLPTSLVSVSPRTTIVNVGSDKCRINVNSLINYKSCLSERAIYRS